MTRGQQWRGRGRPRKCAYNPYTTCPLPPAQNKLRTPVTAGERAYAGPHPEPTPTASE